MKNKKQNRLVTIKAPVGSLIISPEEVNYTLRKIFNSGMRCLKENPDTDKNDEVYFKKVLKETLSHFKTKKWQ